MSKKFLLMTCLTAFSMSAFASECPTRGFDGFSVGLSAAYRIQTAKDKVTTKAYNVTGTTGGKTAAEVKAEALTAISGFITNPPQIDVGKNVTSAADPDIASIVKTGFFDKLDSLMSPYGLTTSVSGDSWTWGTGQYDTTPTYTFAGVQFFGSDLPATGGTQTNVNTAVNGVLTDTEKLVKLPAAVASQGKFSPVAGTDAAALAVKEATTETRSHNQQGAFALRVGYGYSFDKFHIGAELFGEMFSGKLPIKKEVDSKSTAKSFVYNGTSYTYSSDMPVVDPKITLKNKWAFGLTLKPGLTYGNVLFYIPLEINMTRYETKFERNADNIAKYNDVFPTYVNSNNQTVTVTGMATDAANAESSDVNYKKQKTKVGYAFGLGAAIKVSENISVDFRGTYSPNNKLKIDTQAFKADTMDPARLGERHQIKLSNIKLAVGFTWHFI